MLDAEHPYLCPDRAAWQLRTGKAPYPLDTIIAVAPKFITRAQGALARVAPEPLRAHGAMDDLAMRLRVAAGLPDHSEIFFDPADASFWVYPTEAYLLS